MIAIDDSRFRIRVDFVRVLWIVALLSVVMSGLARADSEAAHEALEREDYATALREFRLLAEAGDPGAQYNYGVLHQKGLGTKKSRKTAAVWFRKSADQGNKLAAFALGMMHARGQGAKLDPIEAYVWFWIASTDGHEEAMKNKYRISRSMDTEQIMAARKLYEQRTAEIAK